MNYYSHFFCGVVYGNPNLQYIEDVYKIMTETTQYVPLGFNHAEIKTASEVFLGYLMFDVLISNPERHNENWGCVVTLKGKKHLALSYDHGAGLVRNESDETRKNRLNTKNKGNVLLFIVEYFESKTRV